MGFVWRKIVDVAAIIVLAAAVWFTRDAFLIYLMALFMIFSIFALSYNIMLGYLRLVSFGHSLFFAAAAYGVALSPKLAISDMLQSFFFGIALAAVLSFIVGYITLRHSQIYFAMLTLAFAMLFYALLIKWRDLTGGSDGISGIPRVSALFSFPTTEDYYLFVLLCFAVAFVVLKLIDISFIGIMFRGLGDNENRFKFLGYNPYTYRILALVLSGTFSGLAGALYALLYRAVTPDIAYWTVAAEPLVMSLLGGPTYFMGPVVGAAVFVGITTAVARLADIWQLIMGMILVALLLGARGGLLGVLERLWQKRF
jgi:ABC-type branched-chain amino acid transport system, permease component